MLEEIRVCCHGAKCPIQMARTSCHLSRMWPGPPCPLLTCGPLARLVQVGVLRPWLLATCRDRPCCCMSCSVCRVVSDRPVTQTFCKDNLQTTETCGQSVLRALVGRLLFLLVLVNDTAQWVNRLCGRKKTWGKRRTYRSR